MKKWELEHPKDKRLPRARGQLSRPLTLSNRGYRLLLDLREVYAFLFFASSKVAATVPDSKSPPEPLSSIGRLGESPGCEAEWLCFALARPVPRPAGSCGPWVQSRRAGAPQGARLPQGRIEADCAKWRSRPPSPSNFFWRGKLMQPRRRKRRSRERSVLFENRIVKMGDSFSRRLRPSGVPSRE
jgi:hypothetical protein